MSIFCTSNVNFMFGCACKWPAAGKWGGGWGVGGVGGFGVSL